MSACLMILTPIFLVAQDTPPVSATSHGVDIRSIKGNKAISEHLKFLDEQDASDVVVHDDTPFGYFVWSHKSNFKYFVEEKDLLKTLMKLNIEKEQAVIILGPMIHNGPRAKRKKHIDYITNILKSMGFTKIFIQGSTAFENFRYNEN